MIRCHDHVLEPLHPPSTVYIRTLGDFDAKKYQLRLPWIGAGVGGLQLRCGLAHLIAKRDRPVCRDVLYELTRARNIVSGIAKMLSAWGMADALELNRLNIVLRRHSTWTTDTDELSPTLQLAQQLKATGDTKAYIAALTYVEELCGGRYMPNYDSIPEYNIDEEADYWQQRQKIALRQVALAWLELETPELHARALSAAIRAIAHDRDNPESYIFVAEIARRCGNEALARQYEREARKCGSLTSPD